MYTHLHHLGIAVHDINASEARYVKDFGFKVSYKEELTYAHLALTFLILPSPIPGAQPTRIELLAPLPGAGPDSSSIAKFLSTHGPGLHHLCYEVDDIEGELAKLAAAGYELIDKKPRQGAHNAKIAFIHPRSNEGTLLELCEEA